MKRPDGFDRPAPVAPPTAAPGRSSRIRKPAFPSKGAGRDAARDKTHDAEPETEPITIVSAATPDSPAKKSATEVAQQPIVTPIIRDASAATGMPTTTATLPGLDARTDDDEPARLTSWQARKRLGAAKRARKRYEREEVRRFTWRARKRRRSMWIALGIAISLIAFVIIGAYSPLMALRSIEVTGTNRIPAAEIQAALGEQLGTPLPLIDFGKVKTELATFPLIRSFVTESRPPGTIVVRIVEREPVGLVATDSGYDLLDAAGVVIQSAPERPAGYPVIVADGGVGSEGFLSAAAVIAAMPEGLYGQLDTVSAMTADDVTLGLAGGARVVWGNAERSEYKAVVLGALMVSHPVGSIAEYDVSSPDSAVLR